MVAPSRPLKPAEALRVVRVRWPIESNRHWMLDVGFSEDRSHTRDDDTAENLAVPRRLALNLVRADTHKASVRRKPKRAGWNNECLPSLLNQVH